MTPKRWWSIQAGRRFYSLAAYPPIFPGKNLKTKGLRARFQGFARFQSFKVDKVEGSKSRVGVSIYFQDIKFARHSPHFWENSILLRIPTMSNSIPI
jgi:hypothetical protein